MKEWFEIWNEKKIDGENIYDDVSLFLAMKKANGFDVVDGSFTYEGFTLQFNELLNEIRLYEKNTNNKIDSIYEVGCGSGANLLFLKNKEYIIGGNDYSFSLIEEARKYLSSFTDDLKCEEAIELSVEPQYDVVMSNGVFGYFPNYEYAEKVLESMYFKATSIISLIDIHDTEKEKEYYAYRKEMIPDFEEKYKELSKLFYSKSFFEQFANKHNLKIKFVKTDIKEYWNNDFIYSCYMYK